MLRNNKSDLKPITSNLGFRKEIESVHASNTPYQNGNYSGSNYSMFDGPKAENEHMDRPLINHTSDYETKGEEFHWMANAAYNQSK